MRDDQQALETETLTALGGFVAAYSGLHTSMRLSLERWIAPPDGSVFLLTEVLVNVPENRLQMMFFDEVERRHASSLSTSDRKLLKAARDELGALASFRNQLLHGTWAGGIDDGEGQAMPLAVARNMRSGKPDSFREIRPADLAAQTARIDLLNRRVVIYVGLTGKPPYDGLKLENGRIELVVPEQDLAPIPSARRILGSGDAGLEDVGHA